MHNMLNSKKIRVYHVNIKASYNANLKSHPMIGCPNPIYIRQVLNYEIIMLQ